MKEYWPITTSIIIIIYGAFLLFQAFFPGWETVQEGSALIIAKIIGGVILITWGIVFFAIKRE